jgi:hypothetical protein
LHEVRTRFAVDEANRRAVAADLREVTDSQLRKQMRIDGSWTEARTLSPRLSYRVAIALKCLSLLKNRSTTLRWR